MATQRDRHTQDSHDGSLRPQFLGGVFSGHPGELTRGGLYGQERWKSYPLQQKLKYYFDQTMR